MKNKKHPKKSNAKATAEQRRAVVKPPAQESIAVPSGPPLAGEELERKIAAEMCAGFRETKAREGLRTACNGAEQSAIEAAIVSPRVKAEVEPVAQAFALEQSIAVIRLLLSSARAALEVDKPTPAQILALKIVFETLVEKKMSRIGGALWQESFGLLGFSDHEKSLIENLIQLERGQRAPVADAPEPALDSAEFAETGE
jgi:hypothetical protein